MDEWRQLYLRVDDVPPLSKGQLGLTSGMNLAPTSLVVDVELNVEPKATDWFRIVIPASFYTNTPKCTAPLGCKIVTDTS